MKQHSKQLFIHSFSTKDGTVNVASTAKGLAIVTLPHETQSRFEDSITRLFRDYDILPGGTINKNAEKQFQEYFAGKRTTFSLPLDIRASAFHTKVLLRVAKIPYGKTMTYGEIADAIGHPRAMRAVGTANACNNLPIVIPCHRVVRKDGIGL
jgi:methylated-DNA-[protein]-cysteine S-methyltransferase